jgi:hypothetical protein
MTNGKKARQSRSVDPLAPERGWQDVAPSLPDGDEQVVIVKRGDSLFAVPRSVRNLPADQRELLLDITMLVREIAERQTDLAAAVDHARETHGISWGALGFALGTTPQAAQQRFRLRV